MSINKGVDKEDAVHTHNGMLLSHWKERNSAIATTWMDLEGIMFSEISQTKTNTVLLHLYVEPKKQNE